MTELTLQFDKQSLQSINELMKFYNIKSKAALFSKAITTLKLISQINKTNGELIARKEGRETIININ